ncbi:hypothetical protein QWY16_09155 [Planococcus shenhongbingii]|uniref:hypothetical protein n=1 Tax=Planococcus shenhongbingii TaxID=3058398 RepID=UPI002631E725|nr:hypothetical protein [Planococcus sp. N016]WKA60254.1 hypothetical protein QWY16_09155 [Planococcus sp. N016]
MRIIIHSDQGSDDSSYVYQNLIKEKHAVIESFHSTIKSKKFQYVKFTSLNNFQVVEKVTGYLHYYNEERILEKQAARHQGIWGQAAC